MDDTASNDPAPAKRPRTIVDVECAPPDQMAPPPGDPRRYFSVGFDPRAHACVLSHMNGIAVVCLAPSHPVLQRGLTVATVDFKVGPRGSEDLAAIAISGKKKRGALSVHPGLAVCALVTTNGERHLARCGVKGVLVTVNHRLFEEPALATSDPMGAGHLAVFHLKVRQSSAHPHPFNLTRLTIPAPIAGAEHGAAGGRRRVRPAGGERRTGGDGRLRRPAPAC